MSWFKIILNRWDLLVERFERTLVERPIYARVLVVLLLVFCVGIGVAIRTAPMRLNGFEFFEFDSYIEYWQAKYVYEKGFLAWYTLTRENPDTHIFWYPWGRDFIYTSYPFLPIWTGLTYHIVQHAGFTLHEWASLQPVIFASIAIIVAYFVASELTGSKLSGILASLLMAILPAAVERSIVGFVEKEGVAAVFIFLFVSFYAKMLKSLRTGEKPFKTLLYTILGSLSLGMVGWLWGGYVFILGTVVAYLVLAPLLVLKYFTKEFLLYNVIFVALAMIFVLPSPANARTLGLYPPSVRGLGVALLGAMLLPTLYYFLGTGYKKLSLKKPLLTQPRYFLLLLVAFIGVAVLVVYEVLPISGRLAWALGLRFVPVQPLVESIAEHRSPLAPEAALRMLHDWGVPLENMYLFLASPLILGPVGALYLWYKGEPEKVYLAVAFALAFYSYLNAAYMIATAAFFAVLVVSAVLTRIVRYAAPGLVQVGDKRTKARKRTLYSRERIGWKTRFVSIIYVAAFLASIALTAHAEIVSNYNTVYTFKAGVSGVRAFTDSWYKAIEVLRALPEDSAVISWWDYGYGISVAGGRASVADGSTINNTQIGIIGLIMSSMATEQAARLASLFNVQPGKTYLMIFEGVFIVEEEGKITVWPFIGRGMPGLIDIPKSIWMIRIGNSVVEELRMKGVEVDYVDTSNFFYLYGETISPPFDKPEQIPLLYRLIVDAMLYWANTQNKTGEFCWFTGNEAFLETATRNLIREQLNINVTKRVNPTGTSCVSTRPLAGDIYLKPYAIIAEPFRNPEDGRPLEATLMGKRGVLYSVIIIYEFAQLAQ